MQIEELAEYCDLVMRTIGDDVEFATKYASNEMQLNNEIKETFDNNFTSLANFAYMALHASDETERILYRKLVTSYLISK
jgi:hypothetical protein